MSARTVICWLVLNHKEQKLVIMLIVLIKWNNRTKPQNDTDRKMWLWDVNIYEHICLILLGFFPTLFFFSGQEASTWRVRVWRWRKRSHRHQCWHNWGWSLCIDVDLRSGVTGRTHKRANWLQASSWTSYATYPVWKFAVFIEWCASCGECQTFYNLMGLNIYVLAIKFI